MPPEDAPDADELELLLPQPATASTTVPNAAIIERRFTGLPFGERAQAIGRPVVRQCAIALHMQGDASLQGRSDAGVATDPVVELRERGYAARVAATRP